MICEVQMDLNSHYDSEDFSDKAFANWKWLYEGEFKFLRKYAKNGLVKIADITEVKETIEMVTSDSKCFDYNGETFDFSDEFNEILNNL